MTTPAKPTKAMRDFLELWKAHQRNPQPEPIRDPDETGPAPD